MNINVVSHHVVVCYQLHMCSALFSLNLIFVYSLNRPLQKWNKIVMQCICNSDI